MKTILITLAVLMSSAAQAYTVKQLDQMFQDSEDAAAKRSIIQNIARQFGTTIADDLTDFVYNNDGVAKYVVGENYVCLLKYKYRDDRIMPLPYGAESCKKLQKKKSTKGHALLQHVTHATF